MNPATYNAVLLLSIATIGAGVAWLASIPWGLVTVGSLSLIANFVHLFVIVRRSAAQDGRP